MLCRSLSKIRLTAEFQTHRAEEEQEMLVSCKSAGSIHKSCWCDMPAMSERKIVALAAEQG